MNHRRLSGILVGVLGVALFGWLLYDASAIAPALRLTHVMSEAVAAVLTMVLAAACIAAFLRLVFRSR